jgi:hypothetical protein
MAYALVVTATAEGNGTTSSAVNTTGADIVVACTEAGGGANPTVLDSKSNVWTGATDWNVSNPHCRIWYAINPTVGSGHTFTINGTDSAGIFSAFSGSKLTAPIDQQNAKDTGGFNGDPASPGSITPTEDNELIISCICNGHGAADVAVDSGMTMLAQLPLAGGVHFALFAAYKVQTTAAAINPSWSNMGNDGGNLIIASFKAAPAGGDPGVTRYKSDGWNGLYDRRGRRLG